MSIISDRIQSVDSTKILVMPSKNGKRQLTVYSNTVTTPDINVMCIPVPNPHSVRFEYVPADIFSQCANSFTKKGSCMDYISTFCNSSYKTVIVRSANELHNQIGFIITHDVVEFLKLHYPNYGFILCKLKKGKHTYNPLAYSHDICDRLFIPTKHYHITIEQELSCDYIQLNEKKASIADKWDHLIYSIGTPIWCHESMKLRHDNKINWSKIHDFSLHTSVILNCYERNGYYPNVDITMPYNLSLII